MALGPISLILLVLLLIGAFPAWPHSKSWGYGPSGGIGLVVVNRSGSGDFADPHFNWQDLNCIRRAAIKGVRTPLKHGPSMPTLVVHTHIGNNVASVRMRPERKNDNGTIAPSDKQCHSAN